MNVITIKLWNAIAGMVEIYDCTETADGFVVWGYIADVTCAGGKRHSCYHVIQAGNPSI